MSLPRMLYAESYREPLLPSGTRASGGGSYPLGGHLDADITSDIQLELESESFATEPFHRFSNAAAAGRRRADATPNPRLPASAGTGGSSEERFSAAGGVDEKSEYSGAQPGINHARGASVGSALGSGECVYYHNDKDRTKWEETALYIREGEDNHKFYSHPTGKWSMIAYKILHHPGYHVFHLALSALLMALALLEKPSVYKNATIITVHGTLETLFLCLLGMDIILKLIWLTPEHFIQHRRTMFITVMLFVMFLEALVVLIRQKTHLRVTRSLRPVFFIDTYLMYGVRRVLRQIFKSLKQIVDVILLLFFIITFFALTAYYLFAATDKRYFATFGRSFVSLFITVTTANNPDVMMVAYSQEKANLLFFVIYIVVTVYFISNVLLAVVYSNFAEEEKDKFRKLFLHKREALIHAFRVLTGPRGIEFYDFLVFMQYYRPRIPEWQVMCVFKAMHTNPSEQHAELSEKEFYNFYEVQNFKWRERGSLTFLGPFDFFRKFWNMCDFLAVFLSLIALCLELYQPYIYFAVAVRFITLTRLLRLRKRYRGIINTLAVLTPRLVSASILLLIIYYFFAILGMEFFQEKVKQGCCSNASYGVDTYYEELNNASANFYYLNNFDDLFKSYTTLFILMVVNNWYIIMEGFASEIPPHWPTRIFFICFYIVTLVVLQVVIAFIVEAFVIQLEHKSCLKDNKKEQQTSVVDDSDCIEDEHRKKEVRIVLVCEDIAKLKYVTTYIDEHSHKDHFSFNRCIRRMRRKKLPKDSLQYSGRRLRTKDDLHLWNYRADIQQWIQEQDDAFRQVESSVQHRTDPTFKKRLWECSKKVLTYLLE